MLEGTEPDIIINIDIFTHKVMVYRAEVSVYVAGDQVYTFSDLYEYMRIKRVCNASIRKAAEWLLGNGYRGLVAFTGNATNEIGGTAKAGVTKYKTENSKLYLSPYANWWEEQKATGVWVKDDEEVVDDEDDWDDDEDEEIEDSEGNENNNDMDKLKAS